MVFVSINRVTVVRNSTFLSDFFVLGIHLIYIIKLRMKEIIRSFFRYIIIAMFSSWNFGLLLINPGLTLCTR